MWKNAYLESTVMSADPLDLVRILYRHAIDSVQDARRFPAGDIAARSRAICAAIAAISELDSSLDRTAGGTISQNLAALYHYLRQRLTEANLQQKDEMLAEAESLMTTLAEAWKPAEGQARAHVAAEPRVIPSMLACQESGG